MWSMSCAQATLVFLEGSVQNPMQSILKVPMPADGFQDALGIVRQTRNVIARLAAPLASNATFTAQHHNRLPVFPRFALAQITQKVAFAQRLNRLRFEQSRISMRP